MNTTLYLIQAVLYLLAVGSIPVALTKRPLNRKIRLAVALCPIVLGMAFNFVAHQRSGIFVALMGLWALFFVTIHPNHKQDTEKESEA